MFLHRRLELSLHTLEAQGKKIHVPQCSQRAHFLMTLFCIITDCSLKKHLNASVLRYSLLLLSGRISGDFFPLFHIFLVSFYDTDYIHKSNKQHTNKILNVSFHSLSSPAWLMLGSPSLKAKQHSQHGLSRSLYGAVDKRTQRWEKHSPKYKALKEKKRKRLSGISLRVQWLSLWLGNCDSTWAQHGQKQKKPFQIRHS